jgi:nucleoside-diphosphate kinase
MEQTLVIFKPDAVNRSVIGEILHRFERKGLKIVAMKMDYLKDTVLTEHYSHLKNKPFFKNILKYMKSTPAVLLVLEGSNAVEVVRTLAGPTYGVEAPAGTIRGDYSLSIQNTVIHASDSKEKAKEEIKRFFKKDEIHKYDKIDFEMIYAEDER